MQAYQIIQIKDIYYKQHSAFGEHIDQTAIHWRQNANMIFKAIPHSYSKKLYMLYSGKEV